jgi:hypothetical protein
LLSGASHEGFAKMSQDENMTIAAQPPRPLFVLSLCRAGSTLLYVLLNQHSKVSLLYEADLPLLELYLKGSFRSQAWLARWEFWNQAPSRHGITCDSVPVRVCDVWEATRIVYQTVALRKQAAIWGEKTPHAYDLALRLAEKFPDAQFIFLWRDLRAVMESVARAARTERFFRKAGFPTRMLLGNERLREASDLLKAQGRAVHELNYEDLTSDTQECMRQICQFLQISFEPQITSLEGADRSAISGGDRSHHAMVRGHTITGQRAREEFAKPSLRNKVDRYVYSWKQSSGGKWPKYPLELPPGARSPGILERWLDRAIYHIGVGWDEAIKVTYAFVPLAFAQALRSCLRHRNYARELLRTSQSS